MFYDLIIILPFIALLILAVYVLGAFVMNFFKWNHEATLSFSDCLTLGFFILITVFSVIYCKGNTFLIIPIITSLIFILSQGNFQFKSRQVGSFRVKNLLGFIAVFSVVSGGMVLLNHFDNRLLIHYDISSYARLAHNMRATGQEKLLLDPIYISNYPKELFHFFNEWVTVFISFFLKNLTVLEIMLYVTFPLLTTMIFFQLISITRILVKKNMILDIILISTIVLFLPNLIKICYHFLPNQPLPSTSILHSGLYFIKLKVVLLLSLVSFKFYIQNKQLLAIFIFSLIPIFWNTLIPVFIIGLILLLIYQILNKEKIHRIFYGLQILNFGLLFTILLCNPKEKDIIFSYSILDYAIAEFSNYNYLWKVIVLVLISALPLALLYNERFRVYLNETYKRYFFFLIIASFISYSLIYELYNAKQLIINLIFPILFPLSVYLVSLSYRVSKIRFRFVAIIILVFIICHAIFYRKQFSTDFKVPLAFNSNNKVYIASDLKQAKVDPFYYYIRPYGFLMLKNKYWLPQRIDLLDHNKFNKPIDKYHYYQTVGNQSFFKYAASKNNSVDVINTNDLKLNFLKDYQFEYLLVNVDEINSSRSCYLQDLNIVDRNIFDNDIILLTLKWN